MTGEKMLITEKRHCGKNLVEETLKENGVAGARIMSGGFGGCSINLIEDDSGINNVICFFGKPQSQLIGNGSGRHQKSGRRLAATI